MADDKTAVHKLTKPTLFSAAAPLFNFYMGADAFDRSLYYNLLFQPVGLACYDLAFLSDQVDEHVKSHRWGESLFEKAIEESLVVPYVRYDSIQSFWDVLKTAQGKQGDKSKSPPYIGPIRNGHTLANRFQSLFGHDFMDRRQVWRKDTSLGVGFGNALNGVLQDRDLWSKQPDWVQETWQLQKNCWIEFIKEAGQASERAGAPEADKTGVAPGVRLGRVVEVFRLRLLGENMGQYDDVTHIIDGLKNNNKKKEAKEVELFFKLCCHIYNANMSDSLSLCENFPELDQNVAGLVLPPRDKAGAEVEKDETFDIPLKVPSLELLRSKPAAEILGARDDLGRGYFEELGKWQAKPNAPNKGALICALHNYVDKLSERFGSDLMSRVWNATIVKGDLRDRLKDIAGPSAIGIVIGAAAGGALGHAVGGGDLKTTAIGALGGAVLAAKDQFGSLSYGGYLVLHEVAQNRPELLTVEITRCEVTFPPKVL